MVALWNGLPDSPERSDWHWIEDGDGLRPLLWRGQDWPEPADRMSWRDGFAMLLPEDLRHGTYHGRLIMPPTVAAKFRLNVMLAMA